MAFLFKKDERIEVGLDWLTYTLKFPNEGGFKAKQKYQGEWGIARRNLIRRLEKLLGINHGTEQEKNTAKGYSHIITYDNGINISYHEDYSYMGINIEISGDTLRIMRETHSDYEIAQSMNITIDECILDEDEEEVQWISEPTRIDIAIDMLNTDANVNTLSKEVTLKNRVDVVFDSYDKQTKTYEERPSQAEAYAMMNNGIFNTLYIGRPGGSFQGRIYNKYEEQVNNKKNPVPEDIKTWVRAELEMRQDMCMSFTRSVKKLEQEEDLKSLIIKFFLKKIKFKYRESGAYHRITRKLQEGLKDVKIIEYSKAKPDDLFRAKYEHMIGGAGLISFIQIMENLDPTGEKEMVDMFFDKVRQEALKRDMPKDIKIQLSNIKRTVNKEGYQLPFETKDE